MPAAPGEVLLTTLFADVHYYFNPPSSKPQHHSFDRGSYIYLFHNPAEARTKLEIANRAGTPEQTAFSGWLDDTTRLSYSFKQPNLCTLTVDASAVGGHDQWHLPAYNERNEQKYLYKIHSLDIYLWTEKDAVAFLGHLKAVLPADRQDIRDAPSTSTSDEASLQTPAEHRDSMSPVVQQLEMSSVGANFPPIRAESTTSAQSVAFPGPPAQPAQPAPLAYNPAAPAAPEPIAHREKTPPPLEDGSGMGLANASKYDAVPQQQYASMSSIFQSSGQPTPQQQSSFSGPPQQPARHPSVASFPGPPTGTPPQRTGSALPPPPPGGPSPAQYNPSFAPPPGQPASPPPNKQSFNRQSSYGAPQVQTQYANYNPQQQSSSFGPAALASPGLPGTPGTPGFAAQQQQPPTPSSPPAYSGPGPQQQQQTFGYSNYSYSAQQQPQGYQPGQAGAYSGDVHGQVYRPTEAEGKKGHGSQPSQAQQRPGSGNRRESKLEERVRGVEGKVGGYLKRLDKLF